MTVDRSRLRAAAEAGDPAAARTLKVTRRTSFMLSGAQLGITVTGLLVGYVAEPLIGQAFGELLGVTGVPTAVGVAIGTVLALIFATLVQMLFGELFPKNLSIARAARSPTRSGLTWETASVARTHRKSRSLASNRVARGQLGRLQPATTTVSQPWSRNQVSSPVRWNALHRGLKITTSSGPIDCGTPLSNSSGSRSTGPGRTSSGICAPADPGTTIRAPASTIARRGRSTSELPGS